MTDRHVDVDRQPSSASHGPRLLGMGGVFSSLRARILLRYIALLTVAALASVFAVYQVSLARLNARIEAQLEQEVEELSNLSTGNDPETGRPFGDDVRRIFRVFLQRNIPVRNETMLTFVDGRGFRRSRREPPYDIHRDERLTRRWAQLDVPTRDVVDTPVGAFEYLAVPVLSDGDARGVFVVGVFRTLEEQEVQSTAGAAGVAGLVTLLFGSILAWRVAQGIIDPVRKVTSTAQAISETDLSRRIEISEEDEIGELAATFNDMLDRLEKGFDTQRRFIDDAGHELRTPITIIRGHLEVLGDDPDERREVVALVTDELDRMSRMVNDLLILSKAEQPDFLRLETVDVAALTHELHSKARGLAERDWQVESLGRGVIVADRQRLTQAMMQLAENAAQHTSEGDLIALGSEVTSDRARWWVRDTGSGIPPQQQEDIFRRFHRGRRGPRRSDGAGLGLAIVRAIAEAHHGRVEVSSLPSHGATFQLVVPVDQRQEHLEEEL
ncbi:MAG: ATP-binding protein [Actinomycetota bacterium]